MKQNQGIRLQLRQVMVQQMKSDIIDKISVRQIEVVDHQDNVVMSIGAENGVYLEDSDKNILTIFDENDNENLVLGINSNTGYIKILGYKGSIELKTDFSGGEISIDKSEGNSVLMYPTNKGFVMRFINSAPNNESIILDIDLSKGEVKIVSNLNKVDTSKNIFKSGK